MEQYDQDFQRNGQSAGMMVFEDSKPSESPLVATLVAVTVLVIYFSVAVSILQGTLL